LAMRCVRYHISIIYRLIDKQKTAAIGLFFIYRDGMSAMFKTSFV
jgi:hypothetical protein